MEQKKRENTELRVRMKVLQMADSPHSQTGNPEYRQTPQDEAKLADENKKLKADVKAAYSEIEELRQSVAKKDLRIALLATRSRTLMASAMGTI